MLKLVFLKRIHHTMTDKLCMFVFRSNTTLQSKLDIYCHVSDMANFGAISRLAVYRGCEKSEKKQQQGNRDKAKAGGISSSALYRGLSVVPHYHGTLFHDRMLGFRPKICQK